MSVHDTGRQMKPLPVELQALLDELNPTEARDRVDQLLVDAIVRAAEEPGDDGENVRALIRKQRQKVERWQSLLPRIQEKVDAWYLRQAQRQKYSDAWSERKCARIEAAFAEKPQTGLALWVQTFAEALVDWELDFCDRLLGESFSFPPHAAFIPPLFQGAITAIHDEAYQGATAMLTILIDSSGETLLHTDLDPVTTAVLLIFLGRIQLQAGETDAALKSFERARDKAPKDGRPLAAIGYYHLRQQEYDEAISFSRRAFRLSPEYPDGCSGMGLALEALERWDEAEDWYRQSVACVRDDRDPFASLEKLLAPVSGNLLLQLARDLEQEAPLTARRAVTRALALGINGVGAYPEKAAYELQANILEKMGEREQAADAYLRAGQRYGWEDEWQQSIPLLEHSLELNDQTQLAYWTLSDNVRMTINNVQGTDEEAKEKQRELLQKSVDVWERGAALGPPSEDDSWAFLTRAFQYELWPNVLRTAPHTFPDYWWQALLAIERALLLNEEEAYRLGYLARFYRYLTLEESALAAAAAALAVDDQNQVALEERLISLANTGHFDEAAAIADEWLARDSANAWVRYIRAYIFAWQGDDDKALEMTADHDAEFYWVNGLRAETYAVRGDRENVLKESHTVLADQYAREPANLGDFGWAAAYVALLEGNNELLEEAIGALKQVVDIPTAGYSPPANLGICYLAREETLDKARELFALAVSRTKTLRELQSISVYDVAVIRLFAEKWDHRDQVEALLDDLIEDHIEPRRIQIENATRTPETELAEQARQHSPEDGVTWWAIQAGLARLYLQDERWQEAAIAYRDLVARTDVIPEARLGLAQAADGLHRSALARLQSGDYQAALEQLTLSLELAATLERTEERPALRTQLAYTLFLMNRPPDARRHFLEALQSYRARDNADPAQELAQEMVSLLPDLQSYWRLDEQLQAFADAARDPWFVKEIEKAGEHLTTYLNQRYQLQEGLNRAPVVPRLTLVLGSALIPEGDSKDWPLLTGYIPFARNEIRSAFGIELPGVHIRAGGSHLEAHAYAILVDDVHADGGRVEPDRKLLPRPLQELLALSLKEADLVPAYLATGDLLGYWIADDGWEPAVDAGYTPIEPLLSTVLHLILVARRTLHLFTDVQAVEGMLQRWQKTEQGLLLVDKALPDTSARLRFARLLRALAREQVPLNQWETILETMLENNFVDQTLLDAVRHVRLRLKPNLPGNDGRTPVELPPPLEEEIGRFLRRDDGQPYLAIPPADARRLQAAIGGLAPAPRRLAVLVCRDPDLRPLIRQLIEGVYPHLFTIAQEELLQDESPSAANDAVR